jgi:hypothetical protein
MQTETRIGLYVKYKLFLSYFIQIWNYRQIIVKLWITTFHSNLFDGFRACICGQMCRRYWRHFCNFLPRKWLEKWNTQIKSVLIVGPSEADIYRPLQRALTDTIVMQNQAIYCIYSWLEKAQPQRNKLWKCVFDKNYKTKTTGGYLRKHIKYGEFINQLSHY